MTSDTISIVNGHSTAALTPYDEPRPAEPSAPAIEQVRDLLFGSYNRDAERRFRALERSMDQLSAFAQRLDERSRDELAALQSRSLEEQVQLQARIEELQRSTQERLQAQQREFDRRIAELQALLTSMLDRVEHEKVDQVEMADMLIAMATHMKRR